VNKGLLISACIIAALLTVVLWTQLGGFIAFLPLFVLLLLFVFVQFRGQGAT
jgi:hypothetical protein